MDAVFSMFTNAITGVVGWFSSIINAIPGASSVILASFMLYLLVRVLLGPLIGSAGSDLASTNRRASSRNNPKNKYMREKTKYYQQKNSK